MYLHVHTYALTRTDVHLKIFELELLQVWNFQNGHNLHKMEPVDDSEVTGVLSLIDKEYILTTGWSRKITKYDDSEGDVSLNHFICVRTCSCAGIVLNYLLYFITVY